MSIKRQVLKEQTRKKILSSASKLFLEKDFDLITTEAIAEHAGVSKGIIFHHFKTKEHLGIEVVEELLKQQLHVISPDPQRPPMEKLKFFIEGGLRLAAKTPGFPKLLIQIIGRVGEENATRIFNEGCIPYYQQCTDLFIELGYPNPFLKAQILLSIFDGLGIYFYMEGKKQSEKDITALINEILSLFTLN
ncbi:MAG: TetR/AcrR family transcriptional regulator [Candidatus Hermodarchaeota archaeon]